MSTKNGEELFVLPGFSNMSSYINVPSGTYNLEVKASDSGETVLTIPDCTFAAGQLYSIFVVDGNDDGSPEAVTILDSEGSVPVNAVGGVPTEASFDEGATSGSGVGDGLLQDTSGPGVVGDGPSSHDTSGTGVGDEPLMDTAGSGALPLSMLVPFAVMVSGATITLVGVLMVLLRRRSSW